MTDPDEPPSRQDAFFDSVAAFLQQHAFAIAFAAPIFVVALLPIGSAAVVVLFVIYLGEAIVYALMRRGDPAGRGVRAGPGPGLQALYGLLATIFILGGIVGLGSSGGSVPIVPILAIALGIGIIAWVWHRVSRASGDRTTVLAGRLARMLGQTGGSLVPTLVARLILAAAVAAVAWMIAAVTKLFD